MLLLVPKSTVCAFIRVELRLASDGVALKFPLFNEPKTQNCAICLFAFAGVRGGVRRLFLHSDHASQI